MDSFSAMPLTGKAAEELSGFETVMAETMANWRLPGGQLAIARGDRLVYNRGFGYGNVEDQGAVQPDDLFRIASNSKPITAVAVLMLVDSGDITLDTPVFPLLALEPPAGAPYDARLDAVTVEHLLVHSGGWNSSASFDPQYQPWTLYASHVLDAEIPADAKTIIRFMLGQPLDFDPGTQSAYSNFGFNVLGRLIEHCSNQSYEQFVKNHILTPSGITTMTMGGTTLEERAEGEVRYYAPRVEPRPSVYPGGGHVPVGYGSYFMPAMDSHGGWIARAQDLVRFTLAVDGAKGNALLRPETVVKMESTPRPKSAGAGAGNVKESLGLGWNSVPVGDGHEWSHAGALEGSNCSWLIREPDGTTLSFVFNTLPEAYGSFFPEIGGALKEQIAATTNWPETDLFD